MKREHRLAGHERFQEIRRQGKCWTHRLLVLCILPNDLPHSRFGFSTSKRIGNAVVRNQTRRRLREIVRLRLPTIAPGWDVVLIARPAITQAEFRQIETAVEKVLVQAGLRATGAATLAPSKA
ncbi:MAG: ribonuclease P protein component [Anaerolineae bacterium]